MRLTYFGANSWLLELAQQRILIDPWLVDSLIFGNLPWFFKGDKPAALDSIPDKIDLILLSQGLDDHAHKPTLKKLDKTIPVVGSASAVKVVEELGYTQITPLQFGQTFTVGNCIEIRALPGAAIGPFQQENAYLLKEIDSGMSLYYEPHGYPAAELKDYAPVDVVISPIVSLELPLLGAIIQGHKTALQLAQWVRPQVFLPTAAGGNVKYDGLLNSVLHTVGSLDELRSQLAQHGLSTQVIDPQPTEPLELNLLRQVA
ncbi:MULTISPECIES: MBL fold metallo-hydrolase [unclassified Coleofasciculus]|uniref:MBL fold metallo-hydrolase n=1 Tax=unclassified Coleofasciculus TaxID=2692782 RepID=UPI00187F297F|nr:MULTISPECIES: MBL fold metallo-hydrolase [unclassified Coleofasciculus]MBE9125281.1 MBL fold metallo-hydrolase [Coleofasciculus sp. LEGE 07081]MBE9147062.1 MBL fold metallo-hydrolase [Coleofasciculus sp. LEGE 07092]